MQIIVVTIYMSIKLTDNYRMQSIKLTITSHPGILVRGINIIAIHTHTHCSEFTVAAQDHHHQRGVRSIDKFIVGHSRIII